jgi:hypothetical protein
VSLRAMKTFYDDSNIIMAFANRKSGTKLVRGRSFYCNVKIDFPAEGAT